MPFNSHKNGEIYISDAPVPSDLDQAGYEALTWIKIEGVGTMPDIGVTENVVTFDGLEGATCKAKGNFNAGDPEITYKRHETDPGQIKLLEAGATGENWGVRFVLGDAATGLTRTNAYTRGVVTRPRIIGGGGDDIDLRGTTLGLSQTPIEVHPQVI